jgi:glycosyltransferase involved in cell wall biosynthesis
MLVLCPYPIGVAAVQRFKFERFYDDWRRHGYEVTVSPFTSPALWKVLYTPGHYGTKAIHTIRGYLRRLADLFRIARYDVVFIHAWVTPFGSTLFERLTRKLARKIIYDLEDNLLANYKDTAKEHPNPFLRFLKSRGKPVYLVENSDQVIVSTPFVSEAARQLNRHHAASYIGPSVDAEHFVPPQRRDTSGVPTIGWTGTFSSRSYLDLLRGVLQELARRVPYKLRVIGNFEYELPGVDLEVIQWTAEKEVEDLQGIDIGIYPLATGDWDLGKGGLKAIQYMTVEAPPVATHFGTNPMIIRHGETGFLVLTEDEWLTALETLVRDPELRQRMGRAARVDAVAKFSTQAIAGDYRNLLATVTGSRT